MKPKVVIEDLTYALKGLSDERKKNVIHALEVASYHASEGRTIIGFDFKNNKVLFADSLDTLKQKGLI